MEKNIPGVLLVGGGVVMKGTIEVPQTIINSGEIAGSIKAHTIFIEATGTMRGKIEADVIDVSGVVKDNVVAQENLIIRSTGCVDGNISYADLSVEKSGKISGTLNVLENHFDYSGYNGDSYALDSQAKLDNDDVSFKDGEHS